MLNLYKLEIFAYVAQVGSFSKAAEHFLMSQSGISQHIQDLEASLATPLFHRRPRGVTLTPTGEKLLRYAHDIFNLVSEAELMLTDVAHLQSGTVLIGATPGISAYLLPEWVHNFREQFPNLTASLKTDTTPNIVQELSARQIDIGLVEGELESKQTEILNVCELSNVPQYVVVGPKHIWWNELAISIQSLHGAAMVTRQQRSQTRVWLDALLKQRQVQPRVIGEFDNIESIKRAVISGNCFAILPEYSVHEECDRGTTRLLPFSDFVLNRATRLVWCKNTQLAPVTCAFLTQLKEAFPALDALLEPFCQSQLSHQAH